MHELATLVLAFHSLQGERFLNLGAAVRSYGRCASISNSAQWRCCRFGSMAGLYLVARCVGNHPESDKVQVRGAPCGEAADLRRRLEPEHSGEQVRAAEMGDVTHHRCFGAD
jgi:hypothetical protein